MIDYVAHTASGVSQTIELAKNYIDHNDYATRRALRSVKLAERALLL